jgi:predicted O-methyltransferase YrrM
VFFEAVMRWGFDYRRVQPWISYRATGTIAAMLGRDSRVLEFGSGMSTAWFAQRSGSVVSIESDEAWFRRVSDMLDKRGLSNVDLRLRSLSDYANIDDLADDSFDFVLIDGPSRLSCVAAALPKVKSGGSVYLDNTDDPAERPAEEVLLHAAREHNGTARYFTDYVPGKMTATEGLLVRL